MSISSEIERIQSAKTDIITAIENKGVTVPTGAKINELPELIDSIPSGGGGGGGVPQYSSIWFSQEMSLNLPQTLEKANLCIIFSFVKIANTITMLTLYNGASSNGYVNIGSNGALRVNNESASYSNEIAVNTYDQSVVIRQGSYRRFEGSGIIDYSCPYQNNNIDKISFNGTIKRIAFYYGAINDFGQDNKTIDLRPCIEEGQQGFKDNVSGNFYPLSNCTVAP